MTKGVRNPLWHLLTSALDIRATWLLPASGYCFALSVSQSVRQLSTSHLFAQYKHFVWYRIMAI